MDDRSLRILLEKSEREWGARRTGRLGRFWALAAVVLTAMVGALALPLSRSDALSVVQRMLYVGVMVVFAILALYCWVRFIQLTRHR